MGRKAAVHNLGCKVNAYEAEAMQQQLQEAGYEIVPFEPGADLYVINTCSVTNIADRKSRQMLHRAKKMNPDAIVVAAGCYSETGLTVLQKDPAVDLILHNNQKSRLIELLDSLEKERTKSPEPFLPINREREYEELSIKKTQDRVRCFIKVQDGCNQFCTYCIIPYARGRVRSRRKEGVLSEVRTLAEAGYKEIVLTGIHLSSYGLDFSGEDKDGLLSLITEVHKIPGIERIRLGSLEPGIITPEFARELSALPKVCPHFHLSLQSGCDRTLERMNRRYRTREYEEKCALLREAFELPALTTDVITGFPGETEKDFEESLSFVEKIGFYETHVFPYSRREGTRAASMPDQLTEAVKKERADRLLRLNERQKEKYERSMIGRTLSVLLEEELVLDGKPVCAGYSREYVRVAVEKNRASSAVNEIVTVKPQAFLMPHLLSE